MRIHSKPDRNQSKLSACTTDYNCNNVLVVTQSRRPFEIESPPNKSWDDKPFRGQEVKAASTATASAAPQVPNGPNPPKIKALDVMVVKVFTETLLCVVTPYQNKTFVRSPTKNCVTAQ